MKGKTLICDANILIDFYNGGPRLLKEVCRFAYIVVPEVILDEVCQVSAGTAAELGINAIPVELEILALALNPIPGCSLQDTVCLLLAKKNSWSCATNDKNLRRECLKQDIPVIRGLALIAEVKKSGFITKSEAVAAVKRMAAANRELTEKILDDFYKKLKE